MRKPPHKPTQKPPRTPQRATAYKLVLSGSGEEVVVVEEVELARSASNSDSRASSKGRVVEGRRSMSSCSMTSGTPPENGLTSQDVATKPPENAASSKPATPESGPAMMQAEIPRRAQWAAHMDW